MRSAPRHQFITKSQGDVAKEENFINDNNNRENKKRVQHNYEVVHYTYFLRGGNYYKLEGEKLGLFRIIEVYDNGSVRIQRGIVDEKINIRSLTPHFGDTPT